LFPTISIVTPSFNQGRFLEETILSVIGQEGDFFVDYIIVDGASTDGSVDIIKKYDALLGEGKWPVKCRGIRYRWVSERDKGQAEAINKGFRLVDGEIAAWINSDDYYLDGAFDKAVRILQNDPLLSMVYGGGEMVGDDNRRLGGCEVEPFFDLWKLIHLYDFILQPSVFMRYDALERACFLDDTMHYVMDWDLWIRLSRFGRVAYTPEKLSCARIYPGAKTESAGMERWHEIVRMTRSYGHLRWPPVVLTQFFHKPYKTITRGSGKRGGALLKKTKGVYYRLIKGNASGMHSNACGERVSYLSLPLRGEVAKLSFPISSTENTSVELFINNRLHGVLPVGGEAGTVEIELSEADRKAAFLHLKFVSQHGPLRSSDAGGQAGRCAFRLGAFRLLREDDAEISSLHLPQFVDKDRRGP
jgi:glycosyltransferase involved in cell wall biosynthesis